MWATHYAAPAKHWVSRSVKQANQEREAETRRSAVSGPSFKKFLRTIRDAAQRRLILEKSLLLEAFSRRGE